jgi:hypothetical protein
MATDERGGSPRAAVACGLAFSRLYVQPYRDLAIIA